MPTLEELIKLERARELVIGKTYKDDNGNIYKVNEQGVLAPIDNSTDNTIKLPVTQKPQIFIGPNPPLDVYYGRLWIETLT